MKKDSNQPSNKTKLTLYYIAAAFSLAAAATIAASNGGFNARVAIWLIIAFVYGIILPNSAKNIQK